MEVITIDSKAFQQLVEKVNLIADYVHEARLEQSTNSDEEWVDSQVVCQYLRICEKTLQRLRAAGKVAYSCVGNKYYYQIAKIKRCLKAARPLSVEWDISSYHKSLFSNNYQQIEIIANFVKR